MTTPQQRKRNLEAVQEDSQPYSSKCQTILPKTGPRSYTALRSESGAVTAAGAYWATQSGEDVPTARTALLRQSVLQVGKSEYLVDQAGKRRRLRTWRGSDDGFHLTKLGRAFFSEHPKI